MIVAKRLKKLTEERARYYNCHKYVSVKATRNFTGEKTLDYVRELHAIYYFFAKSSRYIYLREDLLQLQHIILARHSSFLREIHVQKLIKTRSFRACKISRSGKHDMVFNPGPVFQTILYIDEYEDTFRVKWVMTTMSVLKAYYILHTTSSMPDYVCLRKDVPRELIKIF